MPDRRAPSEPVDPSRSPPPAIDRASQRGLRVLRILLAFFLAVYLGVGALLLVLRYGVLPHVDAFRPRIEAAASKALHTPVRIGRLDARWQSLSPEIRISDLRIQGADGQPALRVASARAVLSWRSALHLKPVFTLLEIDGADLLATRDRAGRVAVAGVTLGKHGGNPYGFANWLLVQRAIILRHATLHWRDQLRDAPELTLRDLRLAFLSTGHAHRLGAQGAFADAALGTLDLRAQFRHAPLAGAIDSLLTGSAGAIGNPRNWTGTAYVDSSTLDLVTLGHYLPLPIAANGGQVQTRAWLHFTRGRPDNLSGALRGQDLALQVRPHLPALLLPRLALRLAAAKRDGDGAYVMSTRDVSFEIADQPPLADGTPITRTLDTARFDGAFRPARVGSGERISLAGDVVDIGLLADFSRALPLPARLKRNLDRYDPRGVLTDYRAVWERQAPADAAAASDARVRGDQPLQRYQLHARLDGVSVAAQPEAPGLNAAGHPHIGQPGFHNLRGVIDADEHGGHVTLASRNAALTIRGMFDAPTLAFDALDGEARWTLSSHDGEPHLDARLTSLHFANADAAGRLQARFQADLRHAAAGRLDVTGLLDRAAVPAIPRYLPTSIGPALRGYLAHAFLAGDARQARFDIHGRLPDLPYPHGPDAGAPHEASVFRITAPFMRGKVDLSPHPAILLANGAEERWPPFDDVAGRFFVDGRRLGFDVTQGHYQGVRVDALAGRIADLGDTTRALLIDATTTGPLADYLAYVNASPLGYWSGGAASALRARGPAALKLHLAVPRRRPATSVAATAHAAALTGATTPSTVASTSPVARTGAIVAGTPPAASAPAASGPVAPNRPAVQQKSGMRVAGTFRFDNNHLEKDRLPPLDDLVGQVDFTEHTLHTAGVHARLLGGGLDVSGDLRGDGSVDARVRGDVTPQAALTQMAAVHGAATPLSPATLAGLRRLSGTTDYEGELHRVGHGEPTFRVASNLVGLGIDLPAPLGKAADTAMPLSLDWRAVPEDGGALAPGAGAGATLDGPALLPAFRVFQRAAHTPTLPAPLQRIDLVAGPVRATYLRRGGSAPEVVAGTITVNRAPMMPQRGVTAAVSLARFDADAWRAVASAIGATTGGASSATPAGAAPSASDARAAGMASPAGVPAAPVATASDTAATTATAPMPAFAGATAAKTAPFATDDGLPAGSGRPAGAGRNTRSAATLAFAAPGHAPERAPRFRAPGSAASEDGATQWLPSRFAIDIGELTLLSRHWNDVVVTGNRSPMRGWEAQIDSRQVAGAAEWQPQGGGAIHARFSKLAVPAADPALARAAAVPPSADAARTAPPARHFPAIDLAVDDLAVGERRLGRLELLAHNIEAGGAPVWRVDRFALGTPAAQLLATGNWRTSAGTRDAAVPESDTDVAFRLAVHDGGALLDQLGMPNLLRRGAGTLDGTAHWRGTPTRVDTHTLDGQVAVDIKRGQILKVNPGAARLLGVVNLQGLARIMQLDFKGLFGKGLAFDRLSGTARAAQGIVTIGDGRLTTVPANVTLEGTADIPDKRQDLRVSVVPNLNAGSASIAAAVVNPLLGLSSLVAQLALSAPLSRSLTRHYTVTGAWSAPHVQRVDANRGNMPATATPVD